jgi:uncharacterized protein YecE (DUF72 family)
MTTPVAEWNSETHTGTLTPTLPSNPTGEISRSRDGHKVMAGTIYVGTAGWSIPRASAHRCASEGTHLQRYARVFPCAEINSSFYKAHMATTYAKWAASAPDQFRFAVKLPRSITHEHQLRRSRAPFERFLAETSGLGCRRGPFLVQLPPSFDFDARAAASFFEMVRGRYEGTVVCEPRHPAWFGARADALMNRYHVARVAADPAITDRSSAPGGWTGVAYFRLHGAPRTYWSRYGAADLSRLGTLVRQIAESVDVWCVFDNTASGAALENAWQLRQFLR